MRLLASPIWRLTRSGDGFEMGRRCVHGSGGDWDGRRLQPFERPNRREATDAMAFEKPVDRRLAHAHRLVRRWGQTPQVEEPAGGDIVGKYEKLRIITPEKFPDAIAEPIALSAQLDDDRINWRQGPEAARIGPERIGENFGVAAVVLGAGGREAVTEAIELLRIDRMNSEAPLHQAFDDGAMRKPDPRATAQISVAFPNRADSSGATNCPL